MIALLDAEHLELALVPADHDVEPEPTFADVIGGHHLLGGNHRVEQRRVHGSETGDAPGAGEQAGRPGNGLKRGALVVGDPAISLPASDREEK